MRTIPDGARDDYLQNGYVTLHRSLANITDRPRRGFLAQYSCEPILDPKTDKPKTFAKPL